MLCPPSFVLQEKSACSGNTHHLQNCLNRETKQIPHEIQNLHKQYGIAPARFNPQRMLQPNSEHHTPHLNYLWSGANRAFIIMEEQLTESFRNSSDITTILKQQLLRTELHATNCETYTTQGEKPGIDIHQMSS